MAVNPRQALPLASATAIAGATVLHLARPLRLRSRAGVCAVTLAPASLLPAAAAELALVLLRKRGPALAGAAMLAGCATTHLGAIRRTHASAHRRRIADVELTVMTANLLQAPDRASTVASR